MLLSQRPEFIDPETERQVRKSGSPRKHIIEIEMISFEIANVELSDRNRK